jgi:hypothetical protein
MHTTWLGYATAIGSVATPILVLILTGVGWRMRKRLERRLELEDKLREDRISAYNQILEPFIILLTSDAAWKTDPKNKNKDKNAFATQRLLSLEYREQGFRLSLVGSDTVVKSYNDLMQYFFGRPDQAPAATEADVKEMMAFLGSFLLEIRKSMGNEATALDKWDMLEWFLADARKYRRQQRTA